MTRVYTEVEVARLEGSRAALAASLRCVCLVSAARLLETLPPAGIDRWEPAWVASLRLAKAAAERWRETAYEAGRCASKDTNPLDWSHFARDLAATAQDATALMARLAAVDEM